MGGWPPFLWGGLGGMEMGSCVGISIYWLRGAFYGVLSAAALRE